MLQAITVKYLPATNTKPARLKAIAAAGSITRSIGSLEVEYGEAVEPYQTLAMELCNKYMWSYKLSGGVLPNGDRVFVLSTPNEE